VIAALLAVLQFLILGGAVAATVFIFAIVAMIVRDRKPCI
jgi:hypothetical protein